MIVFLALVCAECFSHYIESAAIIGREITDDLKAELCINSDHIVIMLNLARSLHTLDHIDLRVGVAGMLCLGNSVFQSGTKLPVFLLALVVGHCFLVLLFPFIPIPGDGIEVLAFKALQGFHSIIRPLLFSGQIIGQAVNLFLVFINGLVVLCHSLVELCVLVRRNLNTEILAYLNHVFHSSKSSYIVIY